jgi:hypothetical protein
LLYVVHEVAEMSSRKNHFSHLLLILFLAALASLASCSSCSDEKGDCGHTVQYCDCVDMMDECKADQSDDDTAGDDTANDDTEADDTAIPVKAKVVWKDYCWETKDTQGIQDRDCFRAAADWHVQCVHNARCDPDALHECSTEVSDRLWDCKMLDLQNQNDDDGY